MGALVHHRFDGNYHSGHKARPVARCAEVRHLGVLVQLTAHAVPHKSAHDGKAVRLHILLDSSTNVTHPVSRLCSRDAPCEGFFCDIHDVLCISGNRATRERGGVVAVPAADGGACVDADDIAFLQHDVLRGQAVNHSVIHRDARRTRKAVQPLEVGLRAALDDIVIHDLVDLGRANARAHSLAGSPKGTGRDLARQAHGLDLFCRFYLDHGLYPQLLEQELCGIFHIFLPFHHHKLAALAVKIHQRLGELVVNVQTLQNGGGLVVLADNQRARAAVAHVGLLAGFVNSVVACAAGRTYTAARQAFDDGVVGHRGRARQTR